MSLGELSRNPSVVDTILHLLSDLYRKSISFPLPFILKLTWMDPVHEKSFWGQSSRNQKVRSALQKSFACSDAFSTGWVKSVCFLLNKVEKVQCVLHSSEVTRSLITREEASRGHGVLGNLRPSGWNRVLAGASRMWGRGLGCPTGFAGDAGRGFPIRWLRAKDLICKITALRLVGKP